MNFNQRKANILRYLETNERGVAMTARKVRDALNIDETYEARSALDSLVEDGKVFHFELVKPGMKTMHLFIATGRYQRTDRS